MTPEQVKEKLEGVKWINKEIGGLIFRAWSFRKWYHQKARTEHYQSTNKQGKYSRE